MFSTIQKLALVSLLFVAPAISYGFGFGIDPYIGVNAKWRHVKWEKTRGDDVFNKNLPEGDVYAGIQFCDYLAIEGGYEATSRVSRNVVATTQFLTFPLTLPPESFTTKVQLKGWHADIVGLIPVWDDCLSILGSLGMASLKAYHQIYETADSVGPFPDDLIASSLRTFKKHKSVLKWGVGLQQMLTNCAGVRLMYNWEQTSKFRNLRPQGFPNSVLRVSMGNSQGVGLGVFILF